MTALAAILLALVSQEGRAFHADPAGDDAREGTSPATAWKTLSRAGRETYRPGDRLLLKRGAEWNEGLVIRGRGTKERPVEIGAFGQGPRPRINGGATHAITSDGPMSAWRISGLELTSTNDRNPGRRQLGGTCGIFFEQAERSESLEVRDCRIHDTSGPGIYLHAQGPPKAVFEMVTIERCRIWNASCGIQFWNKSLKPDYFPGFRISRVVVHDIGGDGIVPFAGRDGVVERCLATRTGLGVHESDHSPVAIWLCGNERCTIRFCEAWDNRDGGRGKDGGGFDIDGASTDCVLEHNYSHDNEGAGYLLCTFDRRGYPTKGSVCRYNLSVNDGLKNDFAGITFWNCDDAKIHNNTIITRRASPFLFLSEGKGNVIENNIFLVDSARDIPLVKSEFSIAGSEFRGNVGWRTSGPAGFAIPGGGAVDGVRIVDPMLVDPWGVDARLKPGSPCLEGGTRIGFGEPAPAEKGIRRPSDDEIRRMEDAMPDRATALPARPRRLLVVGHEPAHAPVPYCARALEIMGRATGAFEAVVTDDGSFFEPQKLAGFDAVVVNNWHGWNPFRAGDAPRESARKKALLDFVSEGKGLVGIHAAAVGLNEWKEYGEMLGGKYAALPWMDALVRVEDPSHPLTSAFQGRSFRIADEIYELKEPYARDKVRVLLSVDPSEVGRDKSVRYGKPLRTDGDYPLSWVKAHGKGRVFYCALGHFNETYWNPLLLRHFLDGIQFALGDMIK
jgi:hypothetical protein